VEAAVSNLISDLSSHSHADAKRRLRPGDASLAAFCRLTEEQVAADYGVAVADLRQRSRRAAAAFARQSAMYLAHVVYGASFTRVGALFGRDRTTVAHACRLVEDRREDPRIDGRLARLERRLRAVLAEGADAERRP
jgi:hypothetical protein